MRNYNIVLVDDDKSVLFALNLLIKACGHKVKEFNSAQEALEFVKVASSNEIDLIISDLRMPNLDGFGFLTELRKCDPELPFIMMSGHADQQDKEHAHELGCNAFLSKPFNPTQLNSCLAQVMVENQANRDSRKIILGNTVNQ